MSHLNLAPSQRTSGGRECQMCIYVECVALGTGKRYGLRHRTPRFVAVDCILMRHEHSAWKRRVRRGARGHLGRKCTVDRSIGGTSVRDGNLIRMDWLRNSCDCCTRGLRNRLGVLFLYPTTLCVMLCVLCVMLGGLSHALHLHSIGCRPDGTHTAF